MLMILFASLSPLGPTTSDFQAATCSILTTMYSTIVPQIQLQSVQSDCSIHVKPHKELLTPQTLHLINKVGINLTVQL